MICKGLVAALLLVTCRSVGAFDYIKVYPTSNWTGTPTVYTATTDFTAAFNSIVSGGGSAYSVDIVPGYDYKLDSSKSFDFAAKAVAIRGGFTYRVTAINVSTNELTLDTYGDAPTWPSGLSYAQSTGRIRFFGEGSGPECADRNNFAVKTWDNMSKKLTLWNGGGTATLDITADNLATRPLFVYLHARIRPLTLTQTYHTYLLELKGTGNLTIKHVTLQCDAPLGGGSGNNNANGGTQNAGVGLRIENGGGQVYAEGVQTIDVVEGGTNAGYYSYGFQVTSPTATSNGPASFAATRCLTDNTDYLGMRLSNCSTIVLSQCAFRNWRERAIGVESASGLTPNSFGMSDCWAWCTPDAEGRTGSTSKLRCAINFDPVATIPVVDFTNVIVDIRDVEAAGKSWWFANGGDSCPLVKLQNIDDLEIVNTQLLHGGNNHATANQQFSLKIDPGTGCDNVVLRGCTLSGGIFNSIENTQNNSLGIYGCKLMEHGAFGVNFAISNCNYPHVEINSDATYGITTIKLDDDYYLGGTANPAVIAYFDKDWTSWSTPTFRIENANVSVTGGATKNAFVMYGKNVSFTPLNTTVVPGHADSGVTFNPTTCVLANSGTGGFLWSTYNPTVSGDFTSVED